MIFLQVFYALVCIFLILIVLIQPGKEESLGTLMGGAAAQNLFGSRTTTVLTKITTVRAGIYMLIAVLVAGVMDYRTKASEALKILQEEVQDQEATQQLPTEATPFMIEEEAPSPQETARSRAGRHA